MKIEVTGETSNNERAAATSEIYLCKYGQYLLVSDKEALSKGEKLNDRHINFVQTLPKAQFPSVKGLGCTLFQSKPCAKIIKSGLSNLVFKLCNVKKTTGF